MLTERYQEIRNATVQLCALLSPEDHTVQVAEFASPPKWHLGHTTWFFETFLLKTFAPDYTPYNPDFNFIFNSYYESIGERVKRNNRGILFRPTTEEVYAYRKYVDEAMLYYIPGFNAEAAALVEMGLQHEQQHQELLVTDTKYLFSQHPFFPVWDANKTLDHARLAADTKMLNVEGGIYHVGYEGNGFCFDNELGVHKQYIPSFGIMDRPVTNGEYLEFIRAGGYNNFRYWLAEGWDWVKQHQVAHPMYWILKNEEYYFFHLDGVKRLDLSLPVMHISYYEAEAYAHWKGLSLPTEFEWETAAKAYPEYFKDLVWEWTQSAYLPYPGYTIAPGALGEYNGKFMSSQMVLRGGSVATPKGHSRNTYRNFFHPWLQWQFSGLRLVNRKTDELI